MHLHDTSLVNENIVIDNNNEYNFLGANLELVNCRITCRVSANSFGLADVILKGCQFKAVKRLTSLRWHGARICDSTFLGTFDGNDFGHSERLSRFGSIEHCDFSGAKLDACRFFECNPTTMILPKWPNYSILDPSKHAPVMKKASPPRRFLPSLTAIGVEGPEVTIVTGSLTSMKKFDVSELDELKDFLQRFDFVIM